MEYLTLPQGEIALYHDFAVRILQGQLPYKDFLPEYPPFALPFFVFAQLAGDKWFTLRWYGEIGLFIFFAVILLKLLKANYYIFLAFIFPLISVLADRFDIIPATFTLLSIYLAKKKHLLAYFILGIAVLIKVYPLILLPVILFYKPSLKGLFLFLLPIVLTIVYVYSYGGSFSNLIDRQTKRGIQIESIRALPFLIHKKGIIEYKNYTYEIR